MLVEPKINAPFKGKVTIETIHEEVVLTISNGKDKKQYFLRKSDVAKVNELAGISGKIEGKLYIPHKDSCIPEISAVSEVLLSHFKRRFLPERTYSTYF